jgi:hypothetical protein
VRLEPTETTELVVYDMCTAFRKHWVAFRMLGLCILCTDIRERNTCSKLHIEARLQQDRGRLIELWYKWLHNGGVLNMLRVDCLRDTDAQPLHQRLEELSASLCEDVWKKPGNTIILRLYMTASECGGKHLFRVWHWHLCGEAQCGSLFSFCSYTITIKDKAYCS